MLVWMRHPRLMLPVPLLLKWISRTGAHVRKQHEIPIYQHVCSAGSGDVEGVLAPACAPASLGDTGKDAWGQLLVSVTKGSSRQRLGWRWSQEPTVGHKKPQWY